MSCMDSSHKLMFGRNIRRFRESLGMTQEHLAEASGLDRSYIGGIERGERNPTLTVIFHLATALSVAPPHLFERFHVARLDSMDSMMTASTDDGLAIRFKYDQYDAEYLLSGATQNQFIEMLSVLKDGLARGNGKAGAVAETFIHAVHVWPDTNPSDLWTFVVNRAYCDRSNHPHTDARLNLEQSWKRTSGWALERVLVAHYGPFLMQNGITLNISNKADKSRLLANVGAPGLIPDKADVMLSYHSGGKEQLMGVVHVKASIAERRTDDVPMSQILIESGYLSIFWTMDCKSFPSTHPLNRGEFGNLGDQQVSDKRRDFEEHGHFSACFSYNQNTIPTPSDSNAAAPIYVCGFKDPDDRFSQFLIAALDRLLCR